MSRKRTAVLGAAIALALFAASGPAAAQDCRTRDTDPCPDLPPSIDIHPLDGTSLTSASTQIQVVATDDHAVSSVTMTLNGSSGGISGGLSEVGPYAQTGIVTVLLQPGANTFAVAVCDDSGINLCVSHSVQITYTPPASPPSRQAPSLSLVTHDRWHSAALYGSTLSYSTPAYVSLDQSRGVTLVYASNQAAPQGFVQVEGRDDSTDPIQHMSITVVAANGAVVAPERFYQAGAGVNRLAAQWDVSTLSSGVYLYTVEVKSYWATGSPLTSTLQARVIVLNEQQPFGRGWSIAGLKRVVADTSGVLVINGDATASYYEKVGLQYVRPAGETGELTVNWAGDLVQSYPDGTYARFVSGRLATVTDRFGNETTYTYSGGRITTITDPAGRQVTFAYTGNFLSGITTPKGSSSFTYNATAQTLTSVSDQGTALAATYAADGKLSYWLDRNGERWDVSYDAFGRVDSLVAPVVVAGGSSVRPVTAIRGIPAVALPAPDSAATRVAAVGRRQPSSLAARVTGPRGEVRLVREDRFGNPIHVAEPLGAWTTLSRDENGRVAFVTDSRGRAESYSWDPRGLLLSSSNAVTGQHLTVTYDTVTPASGVPVIAPVQVNANGMVQEFILGATGEALHALFAGDTVQSLTYDARGRIATATDANGFQASYFRDGHVSLNTDSVRTTSSEGVQTTRTTYSSDGLPATVVNPLGEATAYTYDELNRLLMTTDAMGRTTEVEYAWPDVVVTDAAGKTFTSSYNALGWLVLEVDPNNEQKAYAYDRGGNLTSRTDRRGLPVTFAYDSLSRVSSRTADGATTTFGYDDPYGRWVAVSNAESTDTAYFDRFGRDTLHVKRMGGQRYAVRSRFHPNGGRTSVDVLSPFTRSIAYSYDPSTMRLERIQDIGGGATDMRYNPLGQVTRETFPGTLGQRQYYYDESNRLSNVWYSAPGLHNTLMRDYQYDGLNRIARVGYADDTTTVFAYDSVGQLASRKSYGIFQDLVCPDPMDDQSCYYAEVLNLLNQQAFTYDAVGNRTDSGATLQSTSNRYATFDGFTLTYDDEGNLLTRTKTGFSQSFAWNALGQLASVTTNGTTVGYGYDGAGVRVRRTEGGTVNRFLYDGDDLLMELDASGNAVREYTYLPGVDEPHHVRTGGVDYYYARDLQGNVIGAFGTGGVALSRGYTAFGTLTQSTGTLSQPLGFKGRELDPSSGLYYMRNRWYDAGQGRFITEDPIGIAGGINVYAFGFNDPVNRRDPYGLSADLPDPIVFECIRLYLPDLMAIWWCIRQAVVAVADIAPGPGGTMDDDDDSDPGPIPGRVSELMIGSSLIARSIPAQTCEDPGYVDVGRTVGLGLGRSYGLVFTARGVYWYYGFGLTTPSSSVSLMTSNDSFTGGTYWAGSVALPNLWLSPAGQRGSDFNGNWFTEYGMSTQYGASLMVYHSKSLVTWPGCRN